MIGLVGIMATTAIPTYVYNNINVEAARDHDGVCQIETKNGEVSFNANSTTVRAQKSLDLLLVMDGSGSINDDKAKKMFQIYASLLKTLPDDTKVSIALYGTNRATSYESEGPAYEAGPMTAAQALALIQPLADNFAPLPDDLMRAIRDKGLGNGGNHRPYETWFASNLRPDAVHSILQITDEWVDYEEIDYSFAEWAKKNAKTFMSVIMYPNTNTTSYRQMQNAGHPNIYVTGSKDIDTITREVNEQFKNTATETVSKPKTTINVTPEQGLTLKEVKLVSPDGKEENLAISNNKVNIEKDLPQDGKWTVKVKAEGLVHETKKVRATASIGGKEVGKTELVFEGCQDLVAGTKEEKENVNIPFEIKYEDTDTLPAGETKVKQDGVVGTKEIKRVWKTINGEKQGNPTVAESIIKQKVDKIILRGTQQKKTVYYRILDAAGKVIKDNTKVSDGYKGVKYSVTKPTLAGYEIELKAGMQESGTLEGKDIIVDYVAYKLGQGVKAKYVDETGAELKGEMLVQKAGLRNGTKYSVAPEPVLEKGGLKYVYKELKQGSAAASGVVSDNEQVVTFVYKKVEGKAVKAEFLKKDTVIKLLEDLIIKPAGTQVGTPWTSTHKNELVKDNLVYVIDGKVPVEQGKVTEMEQVLKYNYVPKLGKGVNVRYIHNGKELKPVLNLIKDGLQVGTAWSSSRVNEIEKDGLTYVLDEKSLPVENGTVTTDSQEVVYKYVPKLGKGVKVKYMAGDKAIKDELELVKDGVQVGTEWKSEQVKEIEKDGLVYELDTKSLPTENGRVTADSQEVVYKYVPKIGQPVKVKYISGDKEISDLEVVTEGKQVGAKYEKEVIREITKDNVLYRFVGLEKLDEIKVKDTEIKKGEEQKVDAPKDEKPKNETTKEQPKSNKEEIKPVTDEVKKDEPKEGVIELDSKSEINGMKFSGIVNNHEQVYVAKYEMVKSKTVAVTFVDEDGKELQNKVDLVKEDQQVGTEFVYEPKEIEKDGIKYTIEKITISGKDVKEIKGKSTEEAMLYTVHYKEVPEKKLPLPQTGSESTNAAIAFGMMLLGALGFRKYRAK